MADADDFAQLMQRLQSAASTPGTAALPEEASTAPSTTSSTPGLLPNGKKTKGRVKIKMEYINNKLRRYTTFSKRKTGIMKKAFELSTLTGTQVMLLVASETGHVYTYATKKLQPMISSDAGKALIQTCLNTPGEGPDVAPSRSEFTYDAMSACGVRKRKMPEPTENSSSSNSLQFQSFLPTMIPSIFSNFGEDDYNNDESGDDSDSEEAASDIVKEEETGSPSMVVKREEPDTDSVSETLKQTLKEALKAAASTRQQQQKRAKLQSSSSNSTSRSSFVAPFLLQGLTSTSTNNGTVFNLPQGTVFTSVANSEGGANASTVFSNAAKQGDDATLPPTVINPLFNFASIDFQKLIESAQLGVQITNAE